MRENRLRLTVSQLTEYIKGLIDSDRVLSGVYVIGEISNFTYHRSGHLYFTVKDENAAISAVMFRSSAASLDFMPENGMNVIACGRVSVYQAQGRYQLYVDTLVPNGAGALAMQYERIKNKLYEEGLFDPAHKKPLPLIPRVLGIITSPTGAVIRDIINVSSRRFPYVKILLYPALVQGDDAPQTLIDGIEFFSESQCADVVIIGRGGGSMEDLWCFNNEALAKAIYLAKVPIISAVGHETDYTICDFVADVRAPTPSAAAELALPDSFELSSRMKEISNRLYASLVKNVKDKRKRLDELGKRYAFKNPERMLELRKLKVDALSDRLDNRITEYVSKSKLRFSNALSKLEALSPLAVLSRGYAAIYKDQSLVRSAHKLKEGDKVRLVFSDGEKSAKVCAKESDEKD